MQIYTLNPLADTRWPEFLRGHSAASVFHAPGWLTALKRTYGYEPLVATTCPPGAELTNGVVFCRVKSLLTGSRLVSLPFSDHCEPLASGEAEMENLLGSIDQVRTAVRCRYLEIRPLRAVSLGPGFGTAAEFHNHALALSDDPAAIFGGFSKDSIQRKIRRAEREALVYEEGRSEKLIGEFYRLQLLTRRRHQLPPQPIEWFRQLAASLDEGMKVRVAFKDGKAIASIVTLQFKQTMVYKYGCSDADHHNLGGLQMLFWKAIQEAIGCGLTEFDFGRSDLDNDGLATFKERWGAKRSSLVYWATPPPTQKSTRIWNNAMARRAFANVPDWLLEISGRFLYKHVG